MTIGTDVRRPAALLGLSAVWLLLACGPVLAHARLEETYPPDGEALAGPPEQVRLRFNEPVEAAFDPIKVYDQGGDRVDEDDARVDPGDAKTLVADLGDLPGGSYSVEWRVTSADGHVVDGTYGFSVAASDEAPSAAQAPDSDDAEEPEPASQNAEGGFVHATHAALLGLGALVVLVVALLRRR